MPLMALASTAIDEVSVALVPHSSGAWHRLVRDLPPVQPKPRKGVVATLVSHLHTDPVCCRHAPGPLADQQAQACTQLIAC